MPYKSAKQSRYMHSEHPDIAKRWDAEMPQKSRPSRPKKAHKGKRRNKHQPKPDMPRY